MTSTYIWLCLFAIIGYMIVVDQNVTRYIFLLCNLIKTKIESFFLIIWLHPRNPIANFIVNMRARRIAKEFIKEMEKNNEG
jgi:hypothetical protein